MNGRFAIFAGLALVVVGILALGLNLWGSLLGWSYLAPWRLWPLVVVGVGFLFVLPPFLSPARKGLGALFIPGVPVLTTGIILLIASVFNWWKAWVWMWPLEVLAVALGFVLTALFAQQTWLLAPAIIIGANGLLLQFCAVTGLWGTWAVLWTVEPLSVGLALLAVSARTRSAGLVSAGLILCGVAGVGLVGMSAVFSRWWLVGPLGPAVLILSGAGLLAWGALRRRPSMGQKAE